MFIATIAGFVLGFFGSVPVTGPVAMLVVLWAAEARAKSALFLVLGAAVMEAVYAGAAFYGFSALLSEYPWVQPTSEALAALIMVALGVVFARHSPKARNESSRVAPGALFGAIGLGVALVGLNPTMLATWGGAVTVLFSLELAPFTPGDAPAFGLGAALGILSWFSALLLTIGRFRKRIAPPTIHKAIRVAGWLIGALGLCLGVRFVFGHLVG